MWAEATPRNIVEVRESTHARRKESREPLIRELRTPIGAEVGIDGDTTTGKGGKGVT